MQVVELRDKSPDELEEKIVELNKELFNLRFQKVAEQVKNTARVRQVRRTIARIKTVQQEKVLGIKPKERTSIGKAVSGTAKKEVKASKAKKVKGA